MRRFFFIFSLIFLFLYFFDLSLPFSFPSPQELSYNEMMERGLKNLYEANYQQALHFFTLARIVKPESSEPLFYMDVIQAIKEGRLVREISPLKEEEPRVLSSRRKLIEKFLDKIEEKKKIISEKKMLKKSKLKKPQVEEIKPGKKKKKRRAKVCGEKFRVLRLTDEIWSLQPDTLIKIEIGKPLLIEGRNIKRFLTVSPQFIEVKRQDSDHILIQPRRIGRSFLHIWEEKGRWTFNVKVIPPPVILPPRAKEKVLVEAEPLKFAYSSTWRSYYKGRRLNTLERQSLSFDQWLGVYFDTPFGKFDSFLNFSKLGKKSEITGYGVGLSEASWIFLRDLWFLRIDEFTLRGFDIYKTFSNFSFPGQTLSKGVLWEAKAFDNKVEYSFLWGKEKEGVYGYLAPGITVERDSYIEGARVTFKPDRESEYSFNFAKGYGQAREDYLREEVYSLQTRHKWQKVEFSSEVGFDGASLAASLDSSFKIGDSLKLKVNFRDIEKDYVTISGRPLDPGEIGALLSLEGNIFDNLSFSSDLDIYRDRYLPNPGKPQKVNFDWDGFLEWRINPRARLNTVLYYSYTPGLISPRRSLNLRQTYTRRFKFLGQNFNIFMGWGYQRARNPLSPSSDYNSYKAFSGFRVSLLKDISFYLNYNFNWLEEIALGESSKPKVLETGVNISKELTSKLNLDTYFSFRDEEEASFTHSFLAGEDSIETSLLLSYRPQEEWELFSEARLRNVWAEVEGREKYIEAEFRLGLNSSWKIPLRWNPKGYLVGRVFKDINNDGKKQKNEPGLGGVKIKLGRKEITTDEKGYFYAKVFARRLRVSLVLGSLPEAYILLSPSSYDLKIEQGGLNLVEFRATTETGIEGIVFYDKNSNEKFDLGDEPISGARLYIDKKISSISNYEGRYFFRGLKKGRYELKLDVNSLPLEYFPTVPVRKEVMLSEGLKFFYPIPLKRR